MPFTDHFGAVAADYARFRPTYPPALFAWLADEAPGTALAWDAATGSGQAALGLAAHFDRVVATDASPEQLALAAAHPRVTYRVEPAERSSLEDASADVVTVAQALHWLDRTAFFAEADRVLRPGGLLAAWTYGLVSVTPAVDAVVRSFYGEALADDWAPERRLVEAGYAGIVFPFAPLTAPAFTIEAVLTATDLVGYVGSWSAVTAYRARTGADPLPLFAAELRAAWGAAGARPVRWPLAVHVCRKDG